MLGMSQCVFGWSVFDTPLGYRSVSLLPDKRGVFLCVHGAVMIVTSFGPARFVNSPIDGGVFSVKKESKKTQKRVDILFTTRYNTQAVSEMLL